MKISTRKPSPKGFTLLEIVIVLGIIAVIIGGSITALSKFGDGGKLVRVDGDIKNLTAAVNLYNINAGTYPSTAQGLQALVEQPTSAPQPRRWQKLADKVPLDPWNNPYRYRNPGKKDTSTYEIYSFGPDGQDATADDISSQN